MPDDVTEVVITSAGLLRNLRQSIKEKRERNEPYWACKQQKSNKPIKTRQQ